MPSYRPWSNHLGDSTRCAKEVQFGGIGRRQDTCFAIVELMRRTWNRIDPIALIEAYAATLKGDGNAPEGIWNKLWHGYV